MRLASKVNLAVASLLAASALAVGSFFVVSYSALRDETYRWFDANGRNLALTIGSQARESLADFDFAGIEAALKRQVAEDPELLYASVAFGEGLKESRAAGQPTAAPFRSYEAEIKGEGGTLAKVTTHYGVAGVEAKLRALGVIFWGLESFSQKVLKAIRKVLTEADIWHTLRLAREAGIDNAVYTMIGNYQETPEDLEYSAGELGKAYREGLIQYRQTTVCTVMKGTRMAGIAQREGWYVEEPEAGPQMAQVYAPTPWLTQKQIVHYAQKYSEVCPVGVPG